MYIGKTEDARGLRKRLRTFARAAAGGRASHSGGRAFHRAGEDPANASVAVSPIAGTKAQTQYILYAERLLILNWVLAHGRLPQCNKQ